MKKRNLWLILSFLLIVLAINSYVNQNPLSRINKKLWTNIQYDIYSNSLWVSFISEDILHVFSRDLASGKFNFDESQKIETPNNQQILSFCFTENLIWITVTNAPVTQDGGIYVYDRSKKTVNKFLDFSISRCKVLQDGNVIVWGEDKVLIIKEDKLITEIKIPSLVYYVTQDNKGSIWIVNDEGEIYRKDENGLSLILNEKDSQTGIFFDSENNLWVINKKHILLYKNSDISNQQELVIDVQDYLNNAFEDNQNRIWLVLRRNILRYENGQLIYINIPKDTWNFKFGGIDWNNNLAFVRANKGIFEIDLSSK